MCFRTPRSGTHATMKKMKPLFYSRSSHGKRRRMSDLHQSEIMS